MAEQKIIGLYSPAPQSGKSTVAEVLVREFRFTRLGFADPIRAMTVTLLEHLGYTSHEARKLVNTGPGKATRLPELAGKTPREAMQTIGTEWGRKLIEDEFWIKAVLNNRQRPALLVIDDVRFPNEFDAIRREGGEVWRVYRPGAEAPNHHPSEGLLEYRQFDEEIVNGGSMEDLRVAARIALQGAF